MHGKTCGILGTGKIGQIAARIFQGFGMKLVCYDPYQSEAMKKMGAVYMDLDDVYKQADIITLHLPLLPETRKMINHEAIAKMKAGVTIVNVSRGGIVDTKALIDGLTAGKIRAAGLDVYEREDAKFFKDFSHQSTAARMQTWDHQLALLRSFHNVIITPHTAFLTEDALNAIRGTTIHNVEEFAAKAPQLTNQVFAPPVKTATETPPLVEESWLYRPGTGQHARDSAAPCIPAVKFEGETNPDFKVAIFSSTPYVKNQMKALMDRFPSSWFIEQSCTKSTVHLSAGAQAVCLFVNDDADKDVINILKAQGVNYILLRCAGFDRVDLKAAKESGIRVANVPAYSPYAVAEHAVALALALNRHIITAYNRVMESNYTLSGLVGQDLNGKTCGILGTGKIGQVAAKIFKGFGMEVLGFDPYPNKIFTDEIGGNYADLDEVLAKSDFLSVHMPLLPTTHHLIDENAIGKMKDGAILINVSRGGIVKTQAIIEGLLSGKLRGVGLDVYEHERHVFFKNFAEMDYADRVSGFDHDLMLLRSMPNVILSPHIAFLTEEALENICMQTVENLSDFLAERQLKNELFPKA
jgi:D-lactate dehydrogenase